jgi:Holliday junction resolvase-like predicted endonuclease
VVVVKGLLEALFDSDSFVRAGAVEGLSAIELQVLADGLRQSLTHKNKLVRSKAIEVIGYYADEQLSPAFGQLIKDQAVMVRQSAVKAQDEFSRKLQYFDIPIPTTTTNAPSQCSAPPPLIAQKQAKLDTRIAANYQEALRDGDARQKGKALEELLAAVFASIPGFIVSESNYHTATEEIDLVLRNASDDPFWRRWGSLILVEAKNWQSQRVGKNEYAQFYRKLENRGGHCTLGFLICTERFAETFHLERLRDSKFPLRVAPIDGEDLRRLAEAEDRAVVLREMVERAVLT